MEYRDVPYPEIWPTDGGSAPASQSRGWLCSGDLQTACEQPRQTARAFLDRWPAAAYISKVETWRELAGGEIESTMKRLLSAD